MKRLTASYALSSTPEAMPKLLNAPANKGSLGHNDLPMYMLVRVTFRKPLDCA